MASFELDLPDAPGRHNTAHKAALTASRREDEDQGRVTSIDEAAFDDTDGERSGVSSFGRRQLTIASETVESGVNGKGMVEVCCSVTVVIPGESSSNGVGSETRAQERVDSHSAEPTMQKGLSVHTKVATFPRGGQPSGLSVIVFGDEASEDDEEDSRVTAMPSGPESSEDSELPAAATSAEPSPVQNGTNNRKRSETSPEACAPFTDKRGFLYKEGGKHKSWNLRYFVLQPGKFLYYKTNPRSKPLGEVKLKNVQIFQPAVGDRSQSFQFTVHTESSWNKRNDYVIAAQSDREKKDWIEAFKRASGILPKASKMNGTNGLVPTAA